VVNTTARRQEANLMMRKSETCRVEDGRYAFLATRKVSTVKKNKQPLDTSRYNQERDRERDGEEERQEAPWRYAKDAPCSTKVKCGGKSE
jgi:hypothetical protein